MNPQTHRGGGGSGGSGFDRDRELEEQQRHRSSVQDDASMHDQKRDAGERQEPKAYPPGAPLHSSSNSLPIHQPVASRISGAIHSPSGLLGGHNGAGTGTSLGPPPGSQVTGFGGPMQHNPMQMPSHAGQSTNAGGPQHLLGTGFAPIPHATGGPPPSLVSSGVPGVVFGGPPSSDGARPGPHTATFGGVAPAVSHPNSAATNGLPQGQQPILNDALSYLDQVKVQFHEQPDVYNRFLDIMKDFKSQTIDTPGVISRVSDLFAGHPNLIQGFNTFLPPGYRIECGLENNPNSIRVTTPSGSTIHSIGTSRTLPQQQQQQPQQQQQAEGPGSAPGVAAQNGSYFAHGQRAGGWQQPLQRSIESPEASFAVFPGQAGPALFGNNQSPVQVGQFDSQSPAHQQQRVAAGQGQQHSGSSSTHPPIARSVHTPTPTAQQHGAALNGNAAQQASANMEKRGPVEFNHAISYVNKIKNRFQDKPEIYKQFLEILQTYQREQKPIQDVYAQVTTLFHAAPDLLEDFKQFLPESAAQARTRAASHRPGDDGALLSHLSQTPQAAASSLATRDGQKMPPVGSFTVPASSGKENKKRPRPEKQAPASMSQIPAPPAPTAQASTGSGSKRTKVSHKPTGDALSIEPSLTPVLPEPLGPAPSSGVSHEGALAFLDRVKKHIGNRTALHEFLKLINLFTQGLVDKNVLVHKAQMIIGGNAELMGWFTDFVRYDGDDEIVNNRPEPPTGRVSLSNCRGYGPSYRLLPKRERLKPCSGRDELCNSVLNDEWASHPTWASEDSGFVAHRKNAFEEGLHRIEEERHDYDFFIEANQKCIQLLEPIAQQMLTLSPTERQSFRMPPGLGGQSTSIYRRVLKKVYGSDKGADVVNDMFKHPFTVVPVVMARLKQKDEEWRFTQREWEKVWQNQTKSMHLKSLDHQGIQVRANDKRNLSAKHLVDLIKTKHEEQRRVRMNKNKAPRYQYLWSFADQGVLLDLIRFMVLYAMNSGQHGATEKERIIEFFESSVPQFFGIHPDQVRAHLGDIDRDAGEDEADDGVPAELSNGRSRRPGKKSDLLRGLLDPGRNGSKPPRSQNEDNSAASASKETTPDLGSANEEEMPDAAEYGSAADSSNERWLPTVPRATVLAGQNPMLEADGELRADGFFPRPWYNFYCNQTIFVFFSVLQTLYRRLQQVKESRDSVLEEIKRERADKPAKQLGLVHDEMSYFEENPDTFWPRTVALIEDMITGEIDDNKYQDVLRHYYLQNGWTLYTIQDLLKTLCRQALVCNNSDSKEKTPDLVQQFLASRSQEETSYQTEISSRKFAEKCIKDGEMFVICWFPNSNEATVRWLQKNETTFHVDEMELCERWKYYISSFMRVDPTEGIPRSRLQKSLLTRNLPVSDNDSDDGQVPKPIVYHEGLVLRICLNSSKIVYESGSCEYFIYDMTTASAAADKSGARQKERLALGSERRAQAFREKMVMNNAWMKGMTRDDVQRTTEEFRRWVNGDIAPSSWTVDGRTREHMDATPSDAKLGSA